MILVNPFPILKEHFTIPRLQHVDQAFAHNVESMISLSREMSGYSLFYNGPKCGASAPDHMHFQAGERGFMPVDTEYSTMKERGELLFDDSGVQVRAFSHYLRKMISVEGSDPITLHNVVMKFYHCFASLQKDELEPMLNAICSYVDGTYVIHLFPRKLHRPSQYFAEGDEQLLISPASVDFGGVFITPRREDFEKITREDIEDIFKQVSVDDYTFDLLKNGVRVSH